MRKFFFATAIGLITIAFSSVSFAQPAAAQGSDPNIAAKHAIGEIQSIDAAAKQVTIKTDAGSMVTVVLNDKTTYKKLAPGEQALTNATDVTFADLGQGDRVMARGTVSEDRKTVPALMVIVMTKGDLEETGSGTFGMATSRNSRRHHRPQARHQRDYDLESNHGRYPVSGDSGF